MLIKYSQFAALIALVVSLSSPNARAADVNLEPASISGWKVQNYVGGLVIVWTFSSAICGNPAGPLTFPSTATDGERQRFWSMMSAAKLSGKRIFIYYNDSPGVCGTITSFGYLPTPG